MQSEGILSPFWKGIVAAWADLHELHTFDLECAHGADKNNTHRLNKWGLVAARQVNRMAQAALPTPTAAVAHVSSVTLEAATNPSRRRPHKCALQKFHKECGRRDGKLGLMAGMKVASKRYWAKVKAEFATISPQLRHILEDSTPPPSLTTSPNLLISRRLVL